MTPRYIDANQIQWYSNWLISGDKRVFAYQDEVDNIPTADVEEVRHGEWIKDVTKRRGDGEIYDYCCSECQGEAYEGSYGNNDVFSNYCHHCGAKMDGKEKSDGNNDGLSENS